jgi:hypothetical protein
VATQFPIQGDVEITVSYEIIQADRPLAGWGVGLEVYLMTDTKHAAGDGLSWEALNSGYFT